MKNEQDNSYDITDDFINCTTPIYLSYLPDIMASGFFFSYFNKTTNKDEIFLVTNKHVLFDNKKLVYALKFVLRFKQDNNIIELEEIELEKEIIEKITLFHKKDIVDLVLLDITEYIENRRKNECSYICNCLTMESISNIKTIDLQVGDDVLIYGYPDGFIIEESNKCFIKSGKLASKYSDGQSFLIDTNLCEGSSGSIVMTKPKFIETSFPLKGPIQKSLKPKMSKEVISVFIGIYTEAIGVPCKNFKENDVGLRVALYSYLIEEIILEGISYSECYN